MSARWLALLALTGCGGKLAMVAPPAVERPCEARWLTLDRDVVDLVQTADGLMTLDWEHGGIVNTSWLYGEQVLRSPAVEYQDARGLAVVPSGVVWARGDGTVWRLTAGAPPAQLGSVGEPTQVAAAGADVIIAATDGIHRFYPNGDRQRLFDEEVWVMTLDERAVYAQAGGRILRIPLDGTMPETLAARTPAVTSMVMHGGKLLVTTRQGVLAVTDGKLVPHAPLDLPTLIWNLRSAGGRVYFTAGNLVYTVRDGAAVPVAIAHELIGDLEVDGPTLYVAAREYTGVAAVCHDREGAPVELAAPALACADGERETRDALSIDCAGPDGERTYALSLHASGTPAWEHGRDGVVRTWYADGTLRGEGDTRYRADGTPIEPAAREP